MNTIILINTKQRQILSMMMTAIKTSGLLTRTLWPGSQELWALLVSLPALPCLFSNIGKETLLSCFSAIFLYKTSKLLDAQASPPEEVLKIQPKLLNKEPANFFCKRLNG